MILHLGPLGTYLLVWHQWFVWGFRVREEPVEAP